MAYDPAALKLLARGGQADIYAVGEDRVLRVMRDPDHAVLLQNERDIMAALRARGVGVPEVYDYTEAGGLPALLMQRVAGPTMMQAMLRNVSGMLGEATRLARLHCDVLRCPALEGLFGIGQRVDYHMDRATRLDDGDKAFIRGLLRDLPEGGALLHGDFHPGNILMSGDSSYIIDWCGATQGPPASDVANTYLLLADKPRVPGESIVLHRFLRVFAGFFARAYLRAIRAMIGMDMGEFGRWMAVRAAERTVFGQPSELKSKAAFVKACRRMHERGVDPAKWHRAL